MTLSLRTRLTLLCADNVRGAVRPGQHRIVSAPGAAARRRRDGSPHTAHHRPPWLPAVRRRTIRRSPSTRTTPIRSRSFTRPRGTTRSTTRTADNCSRSLTASTRSGCISLQTRCARFVGEPRTYDIDTAYGRFRLSNSVISPAAGQRYLLQVGTPMEQMNNALGRYLELLLWIVLPGLMVVLVAVWWTAGAALAPLSQLAADARRIGIGTLDRPPSGSRRRRSTRRSRDGVQ